MSFSTQLTQWLYQFRTFVNTKDLDDSPTAGRSLGPASGVIGDLYPFLNLNAMTGLFAGLSVSGFETRSGDVRVTKYRSRNGFYPVISGPFAGTGWQGMTGEDWKQTNPVIYPVDTGLSVETPVHALDLEIFLDGENYSTEEWTYTSRNLSPDYRLHYWRQDHGFAVTAVTWRTAYETQSPFLRPCFVADTEAVIDPACLWPLSRTPRLFNGLTVFSAGDHIHLSVSETTTEPVDGLETVSTGTTITLSRDRLTTGTALRTVSGVRPNPSGEITLCSTGLYDCSPLVREIDPVNSLATLEPHILRIRGQDQSCCSCDDYATVWNKVSDLFKKQVALIEEYQDAFLRLKKLRDDLETGLCEIRKFARIRRDQFSVGSRDNGSGGYTPVWQVDYSIILTNPKENTLTYLLAEFHLVSEGATPQLFEAVVKQTPKDFDFEITGTGGTGFQVEEISVPPFSRKVIQVGLLVGPWIEGQNFSETFGDLTLQWHPASEGGG